MVDIYAQLGVLAGALMIIGQFTMLWKDNLYFRVTTRIVVGYYMMYMMCYYVAMIYGRTWNAMTVQGEWWWAVAIILGLLMYTRISRQYAWIAKYPMSIALGAGVGTVSVAILRAQVLDQITYTVTDLFTATSAYALFNAIVIAVALVTTISYFFFTREHTGPLGWSAAVGRAFMMCSIAVIWAGDYMWAMAMLSGVLSYMVNTVVKGLMLGGPIS